MIETIECWILEEYEVVKVADGEYDLQVPYGCDRELDGLVYALLDYIQRAADNWHCHSESRARLPDSDRCWS
ncbi:hypothetical protein [Burkholderia diffusa]|uniref:hypothetical protein n=1 Tax=Burkholderia diffusa TaxID=488732 RepID=UPI00075A506C|nr:hypothetical protein [Burkholderia diffusa]KVH45690.1 hypothetical protein WJ39_17965 [Burkholderia diffusa]